MARKKPEPEGIAAILGRPEKASIQELTMEDFFAAFALQGLLAHYGDKSAIVDDDSSTNLHYAAFDHAQQMMEKRAKL